MNQFSGDSSFIMRFRKLHCAALIHQNGQRLAAKEKGKGHKHHPLWTIRRARGLASPFDIPEVKHAISIGNLWSEPLVLIWEGEMSRLIILPSSTMVIKEMGEFAIVSAAHNVENVVSGPPTPFCRVFCESSPLIGIVFHCQKGEARLFW